MSEENLLIRKIRLQNFLSFGPDAAELELKPLNVLIGPNSSGKSNLLEGFELLRAIPKNITTPIRQGGGISEWLWKGSQKTTALKITTSLHYPEENHGLRHMISLGMTGQKLELIDESVEIDSSDEIIENPRFFYRYQQGHPVLSTYQEAHDKDDRSLQRVERKLRSEDLAANQSILSQRKDPDLYPELSYIEDNYSKIRIYREWNLGRSSPLRMPQKTDLPEDYLLEDGSNLGLVINDLFNINGLRKQLVERLRLFNESIEDISIKIHGGTVQILIQEEGMTQPIPATRLSDGTLRYLCLLSILLHPSPPPIVCIEEPELGLHPDILPIIGTMLVEASARMQLIVTTHSDILVDSLTDTSEAVLVCEKLKGSSIFRRLDRSSLSLWLENYSLGEIWRMGELGGNR
ncbi:MAG: AAA family ATPase [Candidatus Xenobiia bacterium LiM19]